MVPGSHLERGDRETWDLPQENGGDRGPSREELGEKGRGGAGSRPGGGGGTGRRGRRGCPIPAASRRLARTHLKAAGSSLGGRAWADAAPPPLLLKSFWSRVGAMACTRAAPGGHARGDPAAQRAAHGGRGGAMATGARPPGGARARDRCSGLAGGAGRCGAARGRGRRPVI